MDPVKGPNKPRKRAIGSLLNDKVLKTPTFVSPVLQQVGKLAASVASVGAELSCSGSATGNPRNKCALQPGHSLMDWIRLGASGKDLTGLGAKAGYLSVTKQELSKHNKIDDIWLAIRGKVYNATAYLPFHPGGSDELMKAAGIDATTLFDQVHPWVNYEQILQKCLVGKLAAIDPEVDTEKLFFGKAIENNVTNKEELQSTDHSKVEDQQQSAPVILLEQNKQEETIILQDLIEEKVKKAPDFVLEMPKFDWIQKLNYITLIFYTNSFSNPLIEVCPSKGDRHIDICFTYSNGIYWNHLVLKDSVEWPCSIKISWETGKIEFTFKKKVSGIWDNYGTLEQNGDTVSSGNTSSKFKFTIKETLQVTHNVLLMRFERTDGCRIVVPIGKHVRVFVNIDEKEWSRSYTPVPLSLFDTFSLNEDSTDEICLMIKSYENGVVSRLITNKNVQDIVYMTKPLGDFELRRLEKRVAYLILAAGTGITPMLPLMLFLLERRVKKCQFIRVLFFNRTEEDIPFKNQLGNIEKMDSRLIVNHVLSEPSASWTGLSGHVNKEMIHNAIQEHIQDTGYTINDIFFFICGPNQFSELSVEQLRTLEITDKQIHMFSG